MLGSRDIAPNMFPSHLGIIKDPYQRVYENLTTAVPLTTTFAPARSAAATLLSCPLMEQAGEAAASEHWLCIFSFSPLRPHFSQLSILHGWLTPSLDSGVCSAVTPSVTILSLYFNSHCLFITYLSVNLFFIVSPLLLDFLGALFHLWLYP